MSDERSEDGVGLPEADGTPAEAVAGGSQWHPMTTAAVIGGALAATAGAAYLGTRALARRNSSDGRPLNSVMATAITACDLSQKQSEAGPSASNILVASGPAAKQS